MAAWNVMIGYAIALPDSTGKKRHKADCAHLAGFRKPDTLTPLPCLSVRLCRLRALSRSRPIP